MDIKRRAGIKKRVVEIPMKDVEGLKGESGNTNTPPFDSWSWRKYGQKPIKGSPYPRGYYKCSSSKSCPARKQVERSHVDPTMLLVTYSSDHNHPSPPPPRNRNSNSNANAAPKPKIESQPDKRFSDQLGWFGAEVEAGASAAVLESPIFAEQEEEESLFADLGELPECSVVFRRGVMLEREEEQRRRLTCGTTT